MPSIAQSIPQSGALATNYQPVVAAPASSAPIQIASGPAPTDRSSTMIASIPGMSTGASAIYNQFAGGRSTLQRRIYVP